MESAFNIIAEPNRRAILSLLASSERCVGEIERQLQMTQPTVSKHLRVLREAGVRGITNGSAAAPLSSEPGAAHGTGRLARSLPALLVEARGCPGETPGPHGEGAAGESKDERQKKGKKRHDEP
jgi:hypothetical protein